MYLSFNYLLFRYVFVLIGVYGCKDSVFIEVTKNQLSITHNSCIKIVSKSPFELANHLILYLI